MLVYSIITAAALFFTAANSQNGRIRSADADGKYTLQSRGIRAQFIPYGASISNLFVKDKNGIERDVVLGWDNATYYTLDKSHPHLGGVPGKQVEPS
jgi:aldose 1-epimerase